MTSIKELELLGLSGEVKLDLLHRIMYATDASAYREIPLAVVYPRNSFDIQTVVRFAVQNQINLIPRAAGTSLAGQVVGKGIVMDVSKYMNQILEFNPVERWIRVQPGVVLDELNHFCKLHGLFFAPETSTSNRCCIGGMVGNNSCGSHSLVYGSTRDHILEANVILGDGSFACFKDLSRKEISEKLKGDNFESSIYKELISLLSFKENQEEIMGNYPEPSLRRRNSGYAIDELIRTKYFDEQFTSSFNLCKILAGSEGTLAFITDVKLNLELLPPKEKAVICIHCSTLEEAFLANLVALRHKPFAIELMDRTILNLSKQNISQNKNRFFIQGDPAAILIVELAEETMEEVNKKASSIEEDMLINKYGYHYPRIYGKDVSKVWELRKAGLGLLSNIPGDAKPVSVIEDTAVLPERLPAYMADFQKMLATYQLECVYHAHISTGELHLRPILNLKLKEDRKLFRIIAIETAKLVKKYRGSLSGEHGDGRLRGEFIPLLFGDKIYTLLSTVKNIFDPVHIFNRGKIVRCSPMDESLRYKKKDFPYTTYFDYSRQFGWLTAIEQCNGSGDCRKSNLFSGTMCPSYRATLEEKNTTRARANVLREFLIYPRQKKIFDQPEILEILDTCLSCKACKSECPSNVDMARFKAEFLQHHFDSSGIPFRSLIIAYYPDIQKLGIVFPNIYNAIVTNKSFSYIIKSVLGFDIRRSLPLLNQITFRKWIKQEQKTNHNTVLYSDTQSGKSLYLFVDEFTDYIDIPVGIKFVKLLRSLGYKVLIAEHIESGRTELSKGLLRKAGKIANKNVSLLKKLISKDIPLVGIEPSCILSFRDEYPDLVVENLKEDAKRLSKFCLLYDEFIVQEIKKGNISKDQFTDKPLEIFLHGHCHQKSLASVEASKEMLSLPRNYKVNLMPTGCCGMAGSFGYEKRHYDLSMKIGELVLFPAIRNANEDSCISAPGISCRQQIKDGTGRMSYHPIEVLYDALNI